MINIACKYILALVVAIVVATGVMAQTESGLGNDSLVPRVSLVTCHAGSVMYELCGHTAIRVQVGDEDLAVNYGLFEFQSDNFALKFLKGETDYRVGAYPFEFFLRNYKRENRRVVEQELNMTPEQAWTVVSLLGENMRPENCVYRYNYVKNNCATKPVAVIEAAYGDTINFSEPAVDGRYQTFREEMRYFHKNYAWYQFGIDLALGSGIDYVLSTREKMFAPEALESMMRGATVTDTSGKKVEVVKRETVLNEGSPAQLPPTPWWASPMSVCTMLFVAVMAFTVRDLRRGKVTRWVDTVLYGLCGVAGMLLSFLVFVSVHEATSPNWNIVWLNPLGLISAVGVWLKKLKPVVMWYHFANFAVLIILMAGWKLTGQVINWAFVPIISCLVLRSASYVYITRCQEKKVA